MLFEPPFHLHSCCRAPWAWTQRSRHWGRDRPWQTSPERAAWPGCSHLGEGDSVTVKARASPNAPLPRPHPRVLPTPPPTSCPALTSPQRPPVAWGSALVPVSAGSPAASGPVPDSLSAPFPELPGSAAALQGRNPGGSAESSGSWGFAANGSPSLQSPSVDLTSPTPPPPLGSSSQGQAHHPPGFILDTFLPPQQITNPLGPSLSFLPLLPFPTHPPALFLGSRSQPPILVHASGTCQPEWSS